MKSNFTQTHAKKDRMSIFEALRIARSKCSMFLSEISEVKFKEINIYNLGRFSIVLFALIVFHFSALAQGIQVKGHVNDEQGKDFQGVSVRAKSSNISTITDAKGDFSIKVKDNSEILVFSHIGYSSKEISAGLNPMVVVLHSSITVMNDVVVVAYGTTKKSDLTGSVTAISSKDFQKGQFSSPDQLIVGKAPGVQVTTSGGDPGAGATIRIRGGTSLNASNDPLFVIDGVPYDNNGIVGALNPLSLINQNEIESINILKDASAAAIYGSRASNGVIIVTTKKGSGGKLSINFSSSNSAAQNVRNVNYLSADQFRTLVKNSDYIGDAQKAILGTANTNWQNEIFHSAFSTDNNITFSGGIKSLPYRLTYGYLDQNGLLKRNDFSRNSVNLNLSPKFFSDHLTININAKYANVKNNFSSRGGLNFDPTQPLRSGNEDWGGYFEYLLPDGSLHPYTSRNPLGTIYSVDNTSNVNRFVGNIQLDYKFHFLPQLHANANIALDKANSDGVFYAPATSASYFFNRKSGGKYNEFGQHKKSKLFEYNLNYKSEIKPIRSKVEALAGYSYQDWLTRTPTFADLSANKKDTISLPGIPGFNRNTLISFYGRLNYNLMDRYLLTATIRRDGSSRFSPQTRWGNFPSAAFAWKIKEEDFLKNNNFITDLKLRLGWGITGQQDGIADFSYQPAYQYGDNAAQYRFGNSYIPVARPQGFDNNLKWEQTTTQNIGMDLAVLNNRISLNADYYIKDTKDLLAVVPISAGTNFTNQLLTNVGSIKNRGLELGFNAEIVKTENFKLSVAANFTAILENRITKLQLIKDPNFNGTDVGFVDFSFVQKNSIGYRPNTFFMYKQLYDAKGKPIEGGYEDRNGDGIINDKDKFWTHSPDPTKYYGFSTSLSYKKWSGGFALHGSVGNYLYNYVNASQGNFDALKGTSTNLNNVTADILNTGFKSKQTWSDYFLENAAFLRMDNVNVGYNFGKIHNSNFNLRVSATCQNVFLITKYKGLDPERTNGIDTDTYPRPRTYILGVYLDY
jgi:TonB-linked SusC/RagA family outer membrane protein